MTAILTSIIRCKAIISAVRSPLFSRRLHLVFFGSDDFSIPHLQMLTQPSSPATSLTVVTSSAKTPIALLAEDLQLSILLWSSITPENFSEFDVGIVASFGHFIPSWMVKKAHQCLVNIHPSLLPRWRGAAPIVHTLLHGDKLTGVTAMRIDSKTEKFDTGMVLHQRHYLGHIDTLTRHELTHQLAQLGSAVMLDVLHDLPRYQHAAVPQSTTGRTLSTKVKPSMGRIDFAKLTCNQVDRLCRAIDDITPIVCIFEELPVKLLGHIRQNNVDTALAMSPINNVLDSSCPPGTPKYSKFQKNWIFIRCQDGWCAFQRIVIGRKISNRHNLTALEFSNGYLNKEEFSNVCFLPSGDNPIIAKLK